MIGWRKKREREIERGGVRAGGGADESERRGEVRREKQGEKKIFWLQL